MSFLAVLLFFIFTTVAIGQIDTSKTYNVDSVTVTVYKITHDIGNLPHIHNTYIYSGKKTEIIALPYANVALTEKYGRQIFAKVPGAFVYDMDGTGNQMNIATRGLDPHRSWEFNIRKDGMVTNSDMYGYPASHYNIPMEAVERIELVRGTGSLQYGAQFGGMFNYISKQPDSTSKKISFESINTVGTYGLVSTFNSISGKIGKFRYSAWVNKKWLKGYRQNGDSEYDAESISLFYDVNPNLHFKIEWTRSNYIVHLAGQLTDSMFYASPQASTRSRNYYNPDIHIPSISMDWDITPNTKIKLAASAVLGSRNSVLFDKPTNIADTLVTATLQYNNRQVDIDNFNSYTVELRLLQSYQLFKQKSSLAVGIQYMNNYMRRRQQGKGTTGSDFDLTLVTPGWGRDLYYSTNNIAFFAENRWVLLPKLSISTGFRMEIGETLMTGTTTYYTDTELPNAIKHVFPLFGVNAQYDITEHVNIYAGWSQAYRPVIFKDIIPTSIYEISDKNLKDAHGHNVELGFRGKWKFLKWDITGFYLQYNNRLGTLAQIDSIGNLIIYKTNIGNSRTAGVELFVQGDFYFGKKISLSVFSATSFMDARYQDATIRTGNTNKNITNNKVESTPSWISRNGLTFRFAMFSFSALYSYTSESFADALNTIKPSATAAVGLVPAYHLLDFTLSAKITKHISLQVNLNNVLDTHYFTKRPQFYPGPGIWPSDGRTFSATAIFKI